VLATWHLLLDNGRLQDGERFLAGTAPRPHARLSAATAAQIGVATGDAVTVRRVARRGEEPGGQITLPVLVTPMPDGVVWLPTNSPGSAVRATLRADAGSLVRVSAAAATVATSDETTEGGAS